MSFYVIINMNTGERFRAVKNWIYLLKINLSSIFELSETALENWQY